MKDRKQSASPCDYDRELGRHMTARPVGPLADALRAITDRLSAIQREEAKNGTSLILQDPRDLAAVVERLARAGQLEGLVSTWESIGAYALAGIVSASRAAEVRVDSGDAA